MFSLFHFSSFFPGGSADPICPYVRTPMILLLLSGRIARIAQECGLFVATFSVICRRVCPFVDHKRELCQNGWTDRNAVWRCGLAGPRDAYIRWGAANLRPREGTFERTNTHTHLTALFPGLPRWAGTRKVEPIWISLKQETVSGSGISWAVCKSAPRSGQITTPAPHHSVFYRPPALPAALPTPSKHSRIATPSKCK